MRRLRSFVFRLGGLFRRRRIEAELSEELRAHLELAVEAKMAAGMTPAEARRAAQREFGGIEQLKEAYRDERGFPGLDRFLQDLRGAGRMLRKNPGFAATTISIIALGIGATTAIFSMVDCILLRPLPFPDPGRLVAISETFLPQSPSLQVSPGVYFACKSQSTVFAATGAASYWPANLTAAGTVSRRFGLAVSNDFFSTLDVQPMLGRSFRPEEHTPGRDSVVILNYKLWVSVFGSDPGIVGRTVRLNERIYTIVGVMPKMFFPEIETDPGLFTPAAFTTQDRTDFGTHSLALVIGRMRPGVTIPQAAGQLAVIAARLGRQFPATSAERGIRIVSLLETRIGEVGPLLWLLFGAVALLLVITCVNVANLLLVRVCSRQMELAVRAALGASRVRIVRQLLFESLALSLLGGAVGLLIAYGGLPLLLRLAPVALPRAREIAIDGDALGFTVVLTLLTGIGFGVLPAVRASQVELSDVMKEGGRGSVESADSHRLRNLLVVSEVALALMLLAGTGLLIKSFVRLHQVPLGFSTGPTKVGQVQLITTRYPTVESELRFVDQVTERLAAVPGVQGVAFSTSAPAWSKVRREVGIAGRADLDPQEEPPVTEYVATPGYFAVMGIELQRGRLFDRRDGATMPPVAVVSDEFARKYFPADDALGQRIKVGGEGEAWREIVGIVPSVKESGPAVATPFQVYEPFAQQPTNATNLLVRLQERTPGVEAALRAALDTVDPNIPLPPAGANLNVYLREATASAEFALLVFALFGGSALVLCALGIYGVVAFAVGQRTREIGVRRALGAQSRHIRRLVLSSAGRAVGLGLALGLMGAWSAGRLFGALLFDVSGDDPAILAFAAAGLAGVALLACWLPVRRVLRTNPMTALQSD